MERVFGPTLSLDKVRWLLEPTRPRPQSYGIAVLAVGVALLLKLLLDPLIDEESPFLLFFGAAMVAAWFGGLGLGLLATALATLASDYFFLSLTAPFLNNGLGQNLRLAVFVLEGSFISLLVATMHLARRQADASKRQALKDRQSLRESEGRYRLLVESAKDYAIFMLDADGCVANWNLGAERIFGYREGEIVGRHFSLIFTPGDIRSRAPEQELSRAANEDLSEDERWHVRKDGTRFLASGSVRPVRDENGNLLGYAKIARDVTERKRAEEELRGAREAERRRIARDLHDRVLSDLVYALQETQIALINGEPDDSGREAQEATADALRRSVEGLRAAVFDLRLEENLERSFASAVEALVDLNRRMSRKRFEVTLDVEDGFPPVLPAEAGRDLVLVIREALNNARRHSAASRIGVALRRDGDHLLAEVCDDGRGFDARSVRCGVGTHSMRQRIQDLGGELEVQSEPGGGTTVQLRAPIQHLVED